MPEVEMKDTQLEAQHSVSDATPDANWYELRVEGRLPERRAHHTSFMIGSRMYIYGGYDIREGPMQSFWCLDTANVGELNDNSDVNEGQPTLHWQEVHPQGVKRPGAISNHTSVIYNKKMYLYGGSNGLNSNETFYGFDTATNMWEIVRHKPADNNDANRPPASDEHSAVVSGDHMYIFGGFDGGDRINTTYKFNFKSGEWRLVQY